MGSETMQRRFWSPLYDWLAWLYDGVDWFTGNTAHRLRRRALAYLPPAGSRVLEVGFGSGRLHLELAARYAMAGLDLAPGMARLARRRLDARGLRSCVCVGNVYALPWLDGYFDAVLATFAFSAFPDAERALDEMVRVTRRPEQRPESVEGPAEGWPGGRVIIVDAGEASDGNLAARLLAWLWQAFGDTMRNEVPLLEARGLPVMREEYGPWRSVHVVAGTRIFTDEHG